ncbi:MAG: hypothetical protein J6R59_07430 [Paludibacteraceae bacterium]|nr:hypothetical protein [Paludibacteraceae bacterium]MBO5828271.1 hypothetical protein [Paludibacteraceae bacterium]
MKKILLFYLCAIGAIVFAQKPYNVYDWSGGVQIKEYKTSQWSPVQKNQAISGLDSVDVDKKGYLRIIDTRSNLIYKSTSTGKMRILTIINDAKKQNSHTLAAVNQELIKGARSSSNTPTMQIAGATTRCSDEDVSHIDSITSTLAWLAKMAYSNQLANHNYELIMKRHDIPEGAFFEIKNTSKRGYYVNVLHLDKQTQKVNLCYIIEQAEEPEAPFLYIPHDQTMRLQSLMFNIDDTRDIFILVGTEDQYIPEQVQSTLQYLDLDSALPLYQRYNYYIL